MKLLLVHQRYPPEGGGAEVYTAGLARELARRHEVTVLHGVRDATRPDYELRSTEHDGICLISINRPRGNPLGFRAYRDTRAATLAGQVIADLGPDLVHAGSLVQLSTGVVFEARRRGVPVVLTLHDFWPVCPLGQMLDRRLSVCPGPAPERCLGCVGEQVVSRSTTLRRIGKRLPRLAGLGRLLSRASNAAHASLTERLEEMREVLRAVDVVTAPSRFLCERMAALGIPGLTHVPLGHAPLHVPRREADPAGRLRFGYLGALIPSKGVHVLAEAFRLLDDPRAALSIHGAFVPYHGGAGYEARVRSALGHYAGVTLQGSFSSDELGQKLAGLDVLVVPSLWAENAPLVVSEAFLARVPVIVSDLGGLREMVRDEVDGLRVPAGDPSALASAMRRFLEEPGLGVRLASQAPAVPTMAEHAQAMEELYARARARFRDRSGRIGVVVLEHGASEQTARALRSTRDSTLDVRALVVENGCGNADASDGPRLRLPTNRGFAGGMNAGIQALMDEGCDRFLLLNNDATLEPGCLRRLAEALEDPCLAAVGPVILRESDGRVESRGVRVDLRWGGVRLRGGGERAAPRDGRAAPQALSGAVIMLSRAAVERVGLMDEAYFFSFEDVEWCLRARSAGLAVAVILGARARHGGSCTIGRQSPDRLYYAARNHLRLVERHLLLPGLRGQLRRGLILGRHLGHALRQGEIPRWRGMRAVVAGFLDGRRGRFGQRSSGTTHD